jgi:hypothetical protein
MLLFPGSHDSKSDPAVTSGNPQAVLLRVILYPSSVTTDKEQHT